MFSVILFRYNIAFYFHFRFVTVSDLFEPTDLGENSNVFISKSYDATTHFETTCTDVVDIYRRATGVDFDFSKVTHNIEDI